MVFYISDIIDEKCPEIRQKYPNIGLASSLCPKCGSLVICFCYTVSATLCLDHISEHYCSNPQCDQYEIDDQYYDNYAYACSFTDCKLCRRTFIINLSERTKIKTNQIADCEFFWYDDGIAHIICQRGYEETPAGTDAEYFVGECGRHGQSYGMGWKFGYGKYEEAIAAENRICVACLTS